MLLFRRPAPQTVARFVAAECETAYSYEAIGATATTPPAGFVVDHRRVKLGAGEEVFLSAKAALQRWEQFRLGWVEAQPSDTPIREGETIAVVAQTFGLWWLNACRIVYVVDEGEPVSKFGFAYGTLANHVERGEERFTVEWNHADDSVWYDIFAFSQPRHLLARVGYPITRRVQKRFARESAAAMQQAADSSVRTAAER